ncbi:MAG TPA: hypothetical protein VK283_13870 [Acidimicrobiales bacterium]|nr:hypothetical protein [Acidimicrobiales bacterium]
MIDSIELSIPARADLLPLVRLTAGVVAARAGLGLDDGEDLRLGVEELCLSLVGPTGDAPGRLTLLYRWDDDKIEIEIEITCILRSTGAGGDAPADRDGDDGGDASTKAWNHNEHVRRDLSSQILDALVDEHGETHSVDGPGAWLRMRRTPPDAP